MFDMEKRPAIAMKVGVRRALINGVKTDIRHPPILKSDTVYMPTELLPEGCTAQRCESIEGRLYTSLEDIAGMQVKYDTMGLIIIDPDEDIQQINRKEDMKYMLRLMGEFIFEVEKVKMNTREYAPATVEEYEGFTRVGKDALARLSENKCAHPYLFGNKDIFNRLAQIYSSDKNPKLRSYMDKIIADAERILKDERYVLSDDGTDLAKPLANPLAEGDGYDEGGRMSAAEGPASSMVTLAFAYIATGKELFAKTAYYIGRGIGKWEHWGPGHFLNCAGATASVAIAYDWLYEAWETMKLDTGAIRRIIYTHGIHHGYDSVIYDRCDFPSAKQGTGWRFKNKPDNWNAVNNGNLIIADLALLGDGPDGYISEEEYAKTVTLLGANITSLIQDGLVLEIYAPDGSYVESPSYWAYGTSVLFRAIGALQSALGSDLGIHHSWGLDRTCYYAINTESAEFVGWNYHDGSLGSQDTSLFNLFGSISSDTTLPAIRESQLARGKRVSIYDILYHPHLFGTEVPSLDRIPLDCFMEGIDAFTVRSGWERGSVYAGIIGGYNPIGGSHNQLDSGAFVYHNKGVLWFTDLGSDCYNIQGGYFGNYALYRRNGEGNNVLSLKSIKYGQAFDTTGNITRYSTDGPSFAIIDNTEVYGGRARCARRGMWFSEDRRTLVIQDEASFIAAETAYWVGHFKSEEITATLSEDGKSAILTHKDGESVKVSLISEGVRFETADCYDFLLDGTASFEGEYGRTGYSRIVIRFEDVTELSCAVVIEDVTESGYPALIPMSNW